MWNSISLHISSLISWKSVSAIVSISDNCCDCVGEYAGINGDVFIEKVLLLVDEITDDRLETGGRSQRNDGEMLIRGNADVDDDKDWTSEEKEEEKIMVLTNFGEAVNVTYLMEMILLVILLEIESNQLILVHLDLGTLNFCF